jgi:hypothetical protein
MGIVPVFYAAFGYLALLGAILWGMLFVGDRVMFPNMDAAGTAAPLQAACVDLGLLLLLALLHLSRGVLRHVPRRVIPRGRERSTQAWAAAAVLYRSTRAGSPCRKSSGTQPGRCAGGFPPSSTSPGR